MPTIQRSNRIEFIKYLALFTCVFCLLTALPAFLFPLGSPYEADAVDYRVPLIKWILRHRSYPAWPWGTVDDYPMLGELLMLPFYAVRPVLARLVPLFAYVGTAVFVGFLARDWMAPQQKREGSQISGLTIVFIGMAWALGFRVLAMQSSLIMVDNIATCFVLGSLYFLGTRRHLLSGVFGALALATRYSVWPAVGAEVIASLFLLRQNKISLKNWCAFLALVCLGSLPFVIRNTILNHNPVFPLLTSVFGPPNTRNFIRYEVYGFGFDFMSFLKLPYHLLVTNEFIRHAFDYRLGKLFLFQLASCVGLYFWKRATTGTNPLRNILPPWLGLFLALDLVFWFLSAQQLRFLLPSLLLVQSYMVAFVLLQIKNSSSPLIFLLSLLTLGGVFSTWSVHETDFDIAFRHVPLYSQPAIDQAKPCMDYLREKGPVGLFSRESSLGYFDQDFVFIGHHPYAVEQPGIEKYWPSIAYWPADDQVPRHFGYVPLSPAPSNCSHLYIRNTSAGNGS